MDLDTSERLRYRAISHFYEEGATDIKPSNATFANNSIYSQPDLKVRFDNTLCLVTIATADRMSTMREQIKQQWQDLFCNAHMMDGCLIVIVTHEDAEAANGLLHGLTNGAPNAWVLPLTV